MGLWEMVSRLNLLVYGRLLLAAGKNLLLVGAPGVGKTRFAVSVSWSRLDPVVVVGREGLTFDYLVLHYVFDGGVARGVLGDFARAVVSSWLGIGLGLGPRYIVFDEINRCNVDFLLGELFTAMDIEHRMRVPVLRGRVLRYILDLLGSTDLEQVSRELGLGSVNEDEFKRIVEVLVERFKSFNGVPLPYSFRIIATMNMYDRAQLYRLGYALQRRFAFLYMPMPFEEFSAEFHEDAFSRISENRVPKKARTIYSRVYSALTSTGNSIVDEAVNELFIHERTKSLLDNDYPMLVKVSSNDISGVVEQALETYKRVSSLIAYTYAVARSMGVELGASLLVDVVKLYIASNMLSLRSEPLLDECSMADLVLSGLLIPGLSVVIPRIRSEILVDTRNTYELLSSYKESIVGVLGDQCLSNYMLEGYMLELPAGVLG